MAKKSAKVAALLKMSEEELKGVDLTKLSDDDFHELISAKFGDDCNTLEKRKARGITRHPLVNELFRRMVNGSCKD